MPDNFCHIDFILKVSNRFIKPVALIHKICGPQIKQKGNMDRVLISLLLGTWLGPVFAASPIPCQANLNLTISNYSQNLLLYKILVQKYDYIEVSLFVNDKELDAYVEEKPDKAVSLPPYHKWIWVNSGGMHILEMDYRFVFLSMGTLSKSVSGAEYNMTASDISLFQKS